MKYINTDKLKSFIDAGKHRNPCEKVFSENDIIDMVDQMPPADVVEVKHGEWVELPNGWDGIDEYLRFECSECHREVFNNFPFCPYCRADMRGETK